MKRSLFPSVLLTAALTLASLLSGCSGDDEGGGANGLEKTTINVGVVPITGVAPIFLGIKEKVFEKEGLKVVPKMLQGSDKGVPLLARGDLDVLFGNYVTFFQLHDSGATKIKVLAEANETRAGNVTILTKKDSKISAPKDLEGKKVAILIPKGWQELTLNSTVRAGGGDPSKVKYVSMPLPAMGPALERGDIDAAYQGEPFVTTDEMKYGFKRKVDPVAGPVKDWPLSGYVGTQDFAAKYPKTAAAFQRAMFKAQALAADRGKITQIIPTYAKMDPKIASTITLDGYPTSLNPVRLQRVADAMKEEGVLQKPLDVKQLTFTPPAK